MPPFGVLEERAREAGLDFTMRSFTILSYFLVSLVEVGSSAPSSCNVNVESVNPLAIRANLGSVSTLHNVLAGRSSISIFLELS